MTSVCVGCCGALDYRAVLRAVVDAHRAYAWVRSAFPQAAHTAQRRATQGFPATKEGRTGGSSVFSCGVPVGCNFSPALNYFFSLFFFHSSSLFFTLSFFFTFWLRLLFEGMNQAHRAVRRRGTLRPLHWVLVHAGDTAVELSIPRYRYELGAT